jgi:cysteinyl-tRNA synthetase
MMTRAFSSNSSTSSNDRTTGPINTMMLYNTLSGKVEPLHVSSSTSMIDESKQQQGQQQHEQQKGLAWYTCGPTTYAPAHLGHARTYVCLDILRRVLVDTITATTGTTTGSMSSFATQPQPLFVLNITDIDDKIIAAARLEASTGVTTKSRDEPRVSESGDGARPGPGHSIRNDAIALARYYEQEFWRDWDDLNCLRPHIVTRVTEHIESDIVPFIEHLVDKDLAYEIVVPPHDDGDGDGDEQEAEDGGGVYFDVRAFNEVCSARTKYGKLAPPAAAEDILDAFDITSGDDSLDQSSAGNKLRSKKRDPRDFALWKKTINTASKNNIGSEAVQWPSPWGNGRPGWHIECSAMIQAIQGQFQDTHVFQVHAGGVDLKFPHHTNEIAQSEAYLHNSTIPHPTLSRTVRREWIPHWVHTGHLHIDGLKMSKSLKNFVTIRDFLDGNIFGSSSSSGIEDNRNLADPTPGGAFESPSDDFRLWCLGLSGSYRGPATFSVDRMKEARSIRQKILRFLVEGEEWIRQSEEESKIVDATHSQSKKWSTEDFELFQTTDNARRRSLEALRVHDLDGAEFIAQICLIVETGTEYMMKQRTQPGPVEPMIDAIRDVRSLLRLVGFTRNTTEAGIISIGGNSQSIVFGGERALIDELVNFRSIVRRAALRDVRAPIPSTSSAIKEILNASDELRDSILPRMGLQLLDGDGNSGETQDRWMLYSPTTYESLENNQEESSTSLRITTIDFASIPLVDFFKVGQYEEQFAAFTEEGIPTHNADGTEVSKRLSKKLMKKRKAHEERLRKQQSTE